MNKKKNNIFIIILYILFILYIVSLIIEKTGYYERRISKKTTLTEENIKHFEEDIKNGVSLNESYYYPEAKDYSNIVTKSANKLERKLGTLLNTKFNNVFDFIKSLFIS